MKTILIYIFLLIGSVSAFAQKEKDITNAIATMKSLQDSIKAENRVLEESCRKLRDAIKLAENRMSLLDAMDPDTIVKREIEKYTLDSILTNMEIREILEKNKNKSNYAVTYLTIIDMNNSMGKDGGYNKKENEGFKDNIPTIQNNILERHKEAFDGIASKIRDYQYIIKELLRVFKLIDSKKYSTEESLNKDYQLVYINNYEYALEKLKDYIGNQKSGDIGKPSDVRSNIKTELERALNGK